MTVQRHFSPYDAGHKSDIALNFVPLIGLLIMLVMMYRPQGLFPERKRTYQL